MVAFYEGGTDKTGAEEVDEKAKLRQDPEMMKRGKEILRKYIVKFRARVFLGLCMQILGMIQELLLPLFIGWLLDAIS